MGTIWILMLQTPSFLLKVQFTKMWEERSVHIDIPQVLVVNRVGRGEGIQSVIASYSVKSDPYNTISIVPRILS